MRHWLPGWRPWIRYAALASRRTTSPVARRGGHSGACCAPWPPWIAEAARASADWREDRAAIPRRDIEGARLEQLQNSSHGQPAPARPRPGPPRIHRAGSTFPPRFAAATEKRANRHPKQVCRRLAQHPARPPRPEHPLTVSPISCNTAADPPATAKPERLQSVKPRATEPGHILVATLRLPRPCQVFAPGVCV